MDAGSHEVRPTQAWVAYVSMAHLSLTLVVFVMATVYFQKMADFVATTQLLSWSPAAISGATSRNFEILLAVESRDYALSFAVLQTACTLISWTLAPIYVASVLADNRRQRRTPTNWTNFVLFLAVGLFLLWKSQFDGDFYGAADHDYTGSFRPWFGNVVLAATAWLWPMFLLGAPAELAVRIYRSRAPSS